MVELCSHFNGADSSYVARYVKDNNTQLQCMLPVTPVTKLNASQLSVDLIITSGSVWWNHCVCVCVCVCARARANCLVWFEQGN